MEAAIFLLAMIVLLTGPVGLILAILGFRKAGRLETEIRRLSMLNRDPDAEVPPAPGNVAKPASASTAPAPAPAPTPAPAVAPPKSRRRNLDLESVLGGQWLTWTGILALFFGTAFFLGVDLGGHALAGLPQILIGLAVAAVFNACGRYWSSRREQTLGLGLLGGGVALLYLAAYAAFGFHQLIPLWVVFPLLLGAAVVGAILALDRDSLTVASLTLVGALLTPILLDGGDMVYALLPYLAVVNLGAVLVGLRRGWAGLPLAAFAATVVFVLEWWDDNAGDGLRLFSFVNVAAMWLLYSVAPWLRRAADRFWSMARALVLAGNGMLFGLFVYHWLAPAHEAWRGASLAVLAVAYVVVSRRMKARKGEDEATRLTYLTGVALALAAIPVQFDLAWVTIGWVLLAAVLTVAGLRERDPWQRLAGLLVLGVVMVRTLFLDIPVSAERINGFRPVFNGEFLAGLAVIGLLTWLYWAWHRWSARLAPAERALRTPLLLTSFAVLAWKLSGEMVGYFAWRQQVQGVDQTNPGLLWVTLLWAAYGAATFATGVRHRQFPLRALGGILLSAGFVVTAMATLAEGTGLVRDYRPLLNLPFLQGAALAALLGAVFWLTVRSRDVLSGHEARLSTPLLMVAVLMLFVKISLEVVAYFALGAGAASAVLEVRSLLTLSLVWALYAGSVVAIGFARRFKPLRILGICLVGLTVLKVFLMDIQELDQGYRIAAFVALGFVLLAISLLYQRRRREEGAAR